MRDVFISEEDAKRGMEILKEHGVFKEITPDRLEVVSHDGLEAAFCAMEAEGIDPEAFVNSLAAYQQHEQKRIN